MKEERDKLLSGRDFLPDNNCLEIEDEYEDVSKRKKYFIGKNTIEDEMIEKIDNERNK